MELLATEFGELMSGGSAVGWLRYADGLALGGTGSVQCVCDIRM